jgi:hypothetical protein
VAYYCYFDGSILRPHADGTPANRLAREFVFPSGRRCQTFDELALGCQEEWTAARDLLAKGMFVQFFTVNGRADLVKAAQDAQAQGDPDIALIRFLGALPVSPGQAPRLDLNPRRLLLGNMTAGESRQIQLTVSNQGQGMLQGTLKVTEGGQWLRLTQGSGNGQCLLRTPRDQQITLQVDTRGLPAAQTYGAKLTVITNGGVVEVPVRMDLVAHPFARPPFQGAKTPREMAERMRSQPRAAGPLLESGEIGRWFSSNGWNYPVRGTPARGVAGVQQFFEAMGLSKPPVVNVSQPEIHFACSYPDRPRFQVALRTSARKWVYGYVESDSRWLKVLTPSVTGPQQAAIAFEIDSGALPVGQAEGQLKITANAGQVLSVRVKGAGRRAPAGPRKSLFQPVLTMALAFFLFRLALAPVADGIARGSAARAAAARLVEKQEIAVVDGPVADVGGWLRLPWGSLLAGANVALPKNLFQAAAGEQPLGPQATDEFRYYLVHSFVCSMVFWLWWVGAVAGVFVMIRRGEGWRDVPWGLIAGAGVGAMASATVGCVLLVTDLIPHWLLGQQGDGAVRVMAWMVIALVCWTGAGALLGVLCGYVAPLRRLLVAPLQGLLAGFFRICRLNGLAGYCSPS